MAGILDQALASGMPLSRGTMRELLSQEVERRSRAELDLEAASRRNAQLAKALDVYAELLEHLRTCSACRNGSCARHRELAAELDELLVVRGARSAP